MGAPARAGGFARRDTDGACLVHKSSGALVAIVEFVGRSRFKELTGVSALSQHNVRGKLGSAKSIGAASAWKPAEPGDEKNAAARV